jgi:hypothetical protein
MRMLLFSQIVAGPFEAHCFADIMINIATNLTGLNTRPHPHQQLVKTFAKGVMFYFRSAGSTAD